MDETVQEQYLLQDGIRTAYPRTCTYPRGTARRPQALAENRRHGLRFVPPGCEAHMRSKRIGAAVKVRIGYAVAFTI